MVRKLMLAITLLTALFAVAISASQLVMTPAFGGTACGSPCTRSTICVRPCLCYIPVEGGTNGTCQPEGPPPVPSN